MYLYTIFPELHSLCNFCDHEPEDIYHIFYTTTTTYPVYPHKSGFTIFSINVKNLKSYGPTNTNQMPLKEPPKSFDKISDRWKMLVDNRKVKVNTSWIGIMLLIVPGHVSLNSQHLISRLTKYSKFSVMFVFAMASLAALPDSTEESSYGCKKQHCKSWNHHNQNMEIQHEKVYQN